MIHVAWFVCTQFHYIEMATINRKESYEELKIRSHPENILQKLNLPLPCRSSLNRETWASQPLRLTTLEVWSQHKIPTVKSQAVPTQKISQARDAQIRYRDGASDGKANSSATLNCLSLLDVLSRFLFYSWKLSKRRWFRNYLPEPCPYMGGAWSYCTK